jgi:D-sedoheptulose 7-phosphate isomerase
MGGEGMDSGKIPDFDSYKTKLKASIDSISKEDIGKLADLVLRARDKGATVFVFGNGDSATNAMHFAADFSKGTVFEGQKRIRALSLNENVPLMTAWSNDSSYEMVFKEQLENFLKPGDLVIGISTSGNSPNVLRALEYANSHEAITVGLSAMGGGRLAKIAKHNIIAATDNVEIAEDVHWIIGHLVKVNLLRRYSGGD